MSIFQNVFPDANAELGPRVLLIAHSDFAEPTTKYLQRLGYAVTAPAVPRNAAEACAALLFPEKEEAAQTRRRPRWFEQDDEIEMPGPPAFFAWSAFDAVVIQDLWRSEEDERMIPLGCLIATTDYYVRGNFDKPIIVLVTDPEFYGLTQQPARTPEEALRNAFDRNKQIRFVSLLGTPYSGDLLMRIASGIRNGNGALRCEKSLRLPVGASAHETDAPNQARAVSLLTQYLAGYISSRARVVLIDDAPATIRAIAAQFRYDVGERPVAQVHLSEVTAGVTASFASFERLRHTCARIIDEASGSNELLIVVTDILFDGAAWDGERKTGIDLIEMLRATENGRRVKLGIVGLTGIVSPMITMAAFQRGADAVVNKSTGHDVTLHHAHVVDELVVFKLLLTMAALCFQHEFLRAKRQVPPSRAAAECADLRRVLPAYAVSPHLQVEWEATQYLLESQAAYAGTATAQAERAIRRIRDQYD